ncbi:MAG: TonB-dependent receptor [Planctomycetota bacterium]
MKRWDLFLLIILLLVWEFGVSAVLGDDKPARPNAEGGQAGSPGAEPPVGANRDKPITPTKTEEIIVTATRSEMKPFETAYIADVITTEDIRNQKMSRSMPDIFSSDPSVTVQKTSQGQGSPFIRGFTGFRNLLLIDGIRLNNSVFRDGPNEYWNTVDSFTIGRLEIVKGHSSVLYGSDAIGGTVNVITISPEQEKGFSARASERYATADNSSVARTEISGAFNKSIRILVGVSGKNFNELRGGEHTGEQPKTGYKEMDYDLKMEYLIGGHDKLVIAHQRVNQPDVWRTHATIYGISWQDTAIGTDKARYYNHQRQLTYLQYYKDDAGFLGDKAKFSLSYQSQDEQLFRKRSNNKMERSGFDVNTLGLSAQMERTTSLGRFVYGTEFYRDNVDSFSKKYLASGAIDTIEIQGPVADDAVYDLVGVFIQDEYPLKPSLNLTSGVRYNQASIDADKVKDPTIITPTTIAISDSWSNLSGNLRLSYMPTEKWNIFGGVSQGFRAPNLSDLSRLDIALSNEIETPSPNLKPENYLSIEAGAKTGSGKLNSQCAFFYTIINDIIVRYPTGITITGLNEVQKANVGDGNIYGFELKVNYLLNNTWSVFGGGSSQRGQVDTYISAGVKERCPMSKIPPAMAILGIRRTDVSGKWWAELETKMANNQNRLSPLDKLDTQRIPPDGTPGYTIYNIRGGINISKNFKASLGIENISNRDYRIHGSGNNELGRNVILSVGGAF